MDVSTAPFVLDDYDEVVGLWRACTGIGLRAECDSREAIGRYLARNPGTSFVARADGSLAGAVLAGHDGRRGFLHHLAVHPALRRRGIGRRLVGLCLEALAREGIAKVHIFVFRDNVVGREFWEACGWRCRQELDILSIEPSPRT